MPEVPSEPPNDEVELRQDVRTASRTAASVNVADLQAAVTALSEEAPGRDDATLLTEVGRLPPRSAMTPMG